ncbi:synaptotagmin-9-like isoform X2 [Octopus sinensis]|uniref:Synaptotagmin-9-like isoform X2 n=1 Tax=Octopus sinensis TaxID=2607531 RepID=A0A7E6ENW4_9MOLL|nr:synaptotagmin-9-like isoform X2 [Octopus sinensis]
MALPIGEIIGIACVVAFVLLSIGFLIYRRFCRIGTNHHLYHEAEALKEERANLSISQSSPNLVNECDGKEGIRNTVKRSLQAFRQSTLPTVSERHLTFERSLSHKLDLSNVEFSVQSLSQKSQPSIGKIKPELYKQTLIDETKLEQSCGKLYFSLRYDMQNEHLFVTIINATNLPAKDFSGTSDPYVKVYLLPDRKTKFQTKVHRKTLNPEFNETFMFNVSCQELNSRSVQFSLYDFDRFSRHDLIGDVIVKQDLLDENISKEKFFSFDIISSNQEKADLGELMMSLCYLPTAGRLTVTIIKARNLKAMDITGSSDPYVKVALMCQGKRIRKRKTSVKRSTLRPVYNEAIVFDVPQEHIEEISLVIKVVDYDRIGSNEVMGCCGIGPHFPGIGRDHWYEMLENPRKPLAQWYTLTEQVDFSSLDSTPNGGKHTNSSKSKSKDFKENLFPD